MAQLNKLHAAHDACIAKIGIKKAARKSAKADLRQIASDVRSLKLWVTQLRTEASQQLKVVGEQLSQGESTFHARTLIALLISTDDPGLPRNIRSGRCARQSVGQEHGRRHGQGDQAGRLEP